MNESCLRRLARAISICVLGLVLGFSVWQLFQRGYLPRWHQLAISPENNAAYMTGTGQDADLARTITKPCDTSKPEFSILANTPKSIADCIQLDWMTAEVHDRRTYVLDISGRVWEWDFRDYAPDVYPAMICMPGLGVMSGALIALVVEAITRRRHRVLPADEGR